MMEWTQVAAAIQLPDSRKVPCITHVSHGFGFQERVFCVRGIFSFYRNPNLMQ